MDIQPHIHPPNPITSSCLYMKRDTLAAEYEFEDGIVIKVIYTTTFSNCLPLPEFLYAPQSIELLILKAINLMTQLFFPPLLMADLQLVDL